MSYDLNEHQGSILENLSKRDLKEGGGVIESFRALGNILASI